MFSCFCFSLHNNSFSSAVGAECEDIDDIQENDANSAKISGRDENNKENYPQGESQAAIWDSQQHVEKNIFDSSSWTGKGLLQAKKALLGTKPDSGKGQYDGNQQEMVMGIPGFSEHWSAAEILPSDYIQPTALKCQEPGEPSSRKWQCIKALSKEAAEQYSHCDENRVLKLQTLEPDQCPAALPVQEEGVSALPVSPGGQQADGVFCREHLPNNKDWLKEVERVPEEHPGLGTSRLLYHITDGDNPLLSPRSSIFSQSQRYILDPESAPSPPSTQQFMMPRSSSRGNGEDLKEPQTVAQLTKYIHSLKRRIRKYEEKFEQERHYRPSQSDKISNPEVLKWMNDLAKGRKQLKELKLKISDNRANVLRMSQNHSQGETSATCDGAEQQGATSAQSSLVEETMESVWKRLKDKRQLLNLPENLKVAQPEKSLMKPLYDRYRIIKQLLSNASLIPTIEEEDSEEEDSESCPGLSCTAVSNITMDEHSCCSTEDNESEFIIPMDETKAVRIPALSMSNLHEATMPELLEQLRDTRADKKRIRKELREFEDHFLRQTGRSPQKDDRIPMAEEYCEYKQIKAKLRLLEVLINKQEVYKTI